MRVLVFGGSGFLGSALVPLLVGRGHAVTVLTRDLAIAPRIESMGAASLVGDLLEPASFAQKLAGVDVMVLIAQPKIFGTRVTSKRFELLRDQVTRLHANALGLAKERGCPIVITSGTAFCTHGDEVADETWPFVRIGIARIGDQVDALMEQVRAAGSPKFVRLLPGQIYGPGGMFATMAKWAREGRNAIIGDGNNCIPRIHVDDCADAYLRAIEKIDALPNGASFIVADDVACTSAAWSTELARLLGLPPPKKAPRIALLFIRLAVGRLLLETMQMDCRVSNAKLKRELGWQPRYPSYREGMAAAVAALGSGLT